MEKLDLSKLYKDYYSAKTSPSIIEIEPARFLSLAGKGDPSDAAFTQTIQTLYTTAYTIKFICKSLSKDFTVSKLEGLWWFDEEKIGSFSASDAPVKVPRNQWEYRLLIRMPEFVTNEMTEDAIDTVITKKHVQEAGKVQLFSMTEGKCVQILHVGPFSEEPKTLRRINDFIIERQLARNGLHHEIYLSDFRKTPPEKLRTILREPVTPVYNTVPKK
ncbi:MAG: GyrI-like domain-containing protein [Chitinophagaceae bacterium]|nr:GyrI-like domain-containing protein [Chitinophagaceae bacterium]